MRGRAAARGLCVPLGRGQRLSAEGPAVGLAGRVVAGSPGGAVRPAVALVLRISLAQALRAVVVVLLAEAGLRLTEAADDDGLPELLVLAAEAELHLCGKNKWGWTCADGGEGEGAAADRGALTIVLMAYDCTTTLVRAE